MPLVRMLLSVVLRVLVRVLVCRGRRKAPQPEEQMPRDKRGHFQQVWGLKCADTNAVSRQATPNSLRRRCALLGGATQSRQEGERPLERLALLHQQALRLLAPALPDGRPPTREHHGRHTARRYGAGW